MVELVWQDVVLAIGGAVGLVSKLYALYDAETVWSRKASVPNVVFFVPTLAAFYTLRLYLTFGTTFLSFLIWTGIAIWRAPEDEDYIGRD